MESQDIDIIEVVTQLGVAVLSGRTTEAVRVATLNGHLHTALQLHFGKSPNRLVELNSIRRYWKDVSSAFEMDLDHMRYGAPELVVSGERYRILDFSGHFAEMEPGCPHRKEWPCSEPPCSPVWHRRWE